MGTRTSSPGRYSGYAKRTYDAPALSSFYVDAPDGTPLAVDVYRPAHDGAAVPGRFPALFLFTPYRRAFRDDSGETVPGFGLQTSDGSGRHSVIDLTAYGYVVVAADVRGKGASFGTRAAPNDRVEARDGAALVDWIASRPWSNGRVGMFGCSYYGGTTWGVVTERPPALKAAMIGCTAFDKYEGFGGRGGIKIGQLVDTTPEHDLTSRPVEGDTTALESAVAQHRDNSDAGSMLQKLPYRDSTLPEPVGDFWERTSVHNHLAAINRPGIGIYLQGGWDDMLRRETLLSFTNLTVPRKLLMGPWGHCRTEGFDYFAEMHRFFDHWLKDVDNGIMREPAITYFERDGSGSGHWRTARQWPLPEQDESVFFLSGKSTTALPNNGALTRGRTECEGRSGFRVVRDIVVYRVGVDAPRPTVSGEHRDACGLTFTTEPMGEDTALTGHPVARLWISAPDTDADVFAYLSDVTPDGEILTISEGQLRASHRRLTEPPYDALDLPFHSGRCGDVEPLVPDQPTLIEFEFLPVAHRIRTGHRLRLTITGDNATGAGMPPDTHPARHLTVFHDADHPSRIELPLLG